MASPSSKTNLTTDDVKPRGLPPKPGSARLNFVATGISIVVTLTLIGLTAQLAVELASSGGCAGSDAYLVGNCDWHLGWAPPGKEADFDPTYCGESQYTCSIVDDQMTSDFDQISANCPSGCGCAGSFSERARRLEACMSNAHRHRRCVPFEDVDGSLSAYLSPRKNDMRFVDGARRQYLTQESFLDACEAATSCTPRGQRTPDESFFYLLLLTRAVRAPLPGQTRTSAPPTASG